MTCSGTWSPSRNQDFLQRDTVLATGTLVSVAQRRPEADFGTMSRDSRPTRTR